MSVNISTEFKFSDVHGAIKHSCSRAKVMNARFQVTVYRTIGLVSFCHVEYDFLFVIILLCVNFMIKTKIHNRDD